jgi:hypothetical protein
MVNATNVLPVTEHIFETAGLGKAPYKFLRVEVSRGPIFFGNTQVGSYGQPMACCQFCGTSICYKFWLRSSDGLTFYVGSDCIYKSGDLGLKAIIDPIVAAHDKEIRLVREKAVNDKFADYLTTHPDFFKLDTRPHPWAFRASRGETYGMYNEYCYKWSRGSKKAGLSRQFLILAGELDPKKRVGISKGTSCKCSLPTGDGDLCESCLKLKRKETILAQVKSRFKTWSMNVAAGLGLTANA